MRYRIVTGLALLTFLSTTVILGQGKSNAEAGKQIYESKCSRCHGPTGDGKGKDVMPAFRKFMHDWTQAGYLSSYKDDDLFKIITEGAQAVDKSKNANMVAYGQGKAKKPADELSVEQIRDLIALIRTLAK